MEFFDKKEDVIDIVLTRKGREKLSKGTFKPSYYEFHDENIAYDSSFDNISAESQNDIEERIKSTAYTKAHVLDNSVLDKDTFDPENKFMLPSLGTYDSKVQNRPRFEANLLEGEITGSVVYIPLEDNQLSGSNNEIPQLDVVCTYEVNNNETGKLYLYKSSQDILLKLKEENSIDTKDNFIIEAYEYDYSDNSNRPKLKKLVFDLDNPIDEENFFYYFDLVLDADGKDELVDFQELTGPEFIESDDEC